MTTPDGDFEVIIEEVEWVDPTPPKREPRPAPTPPAPHPSIPSLVNNVIEQGKCYLDARLELFKMQAKRAIGQLSGAIIMLVLGVVFALFALGWGFHSGEVALRLVVPDWAAALIVWGVIVLLTIIFLAVGAILGLGAKADAPDPKALVKGDVSTLKADLAEAKEGLEK